MHGTCVAVADLMRRDFSAGGTRIELHTEIGAISRQEAARRILGKIYQRKSIEARAGSETHNHRGMPVHYRDARVAGRHTCGRRLQLVPT